MVRKLNQVTASFSVLAGQTFGFRVYSIDDSFGAAQVTVTNFAFVSNGFTEAPDASAQDLSDSGTVSFGDIDTTDEVSITFASNGSPVWDGGELDSKLAAALVAGFTTGVTDAAAPGSTAWTYDASGLDLDFLAEGESITFSYTVTATDSEGVTATDVVSFTITGTNDPVFITSEPQSGTVTEDDDEANVASGAVTFTDPDVNDVHTASVTDGTDLYGTFILGIITTTENGGGGSQGWSYTLENNDVDGSGPRCGRHPHRNLHYYRR